MRILRELLQTFVYCAVLGFALTGCFLVVDMLNHHQVLPGWWAFLTLLCYLVTIAGLMSLTGNSLRISRRVTDYFFPKPKKEDSRQIAN